MYDKYISLGSNCEAGFQFRRIGYDESSFFRWTLSSFDSTYKLIQNDFQDVYLQENLVPVWDNMVEDSKYNISFHSQLLSNKDPETNQRYFLDNDNFDIIYQEEYLKIEHFIQKWFSLVQSEQYVLYIIKQEKNSSRANAEKLLKLFEDKYPTHRYTIAYIQDKQFYEGNWQLPKLKNIYFSRFAPISQADDGEIADWDRLFQQFPLNSQVK